MTVALYLRVSSEEQRERQSISTQRDYGQRFCALNGLPVFAIYEDDGVTGTIALESRPAGARLLEDAKAGKFIEVLVYKLDRLGRNPRLILNTVNELEQAHVQVKSMTEAFDTSSPAGRLMLGMLASIAGFERDTITERSKAGTDRLARAGAWLGGIVPYGYRAIGKNRESRLIISDDVMPGVCLSEADIIRLIYRMTVEENKSCVEIADRLNAIGVPPSYSRDGREILRGKRKQATSGIWRPGRIGGMLRSTTYKGIHQYGKRSKKQEDIIERPVPAIVSVEVWEKAQEVLKKHFLFGKRNAKCLYLLRGLIKCNICGLTYIGTQYPDPKKNGVSTYYRCNGNHSTHSIYGELGQRCQSKSVGAELEDIVWQDIESFLRNPKEVLKELSMDIASDLGNAERLNKDVSHLELSLASKQAERDLVIGLYRKGRIDDAALDVQLNEIQKEETALKLEIDSLSNQAIGAAAVSAQMETAADLLRVLNERLDQPTSWELKRQIVEVLVETARVETLVVGKNKKARVTVRYRFGQNSAIANHTVVRAAIMAIL